NAERACRFAGARRAARRFSRPLVTCAGDFAHSGRVPRTALSSRRMLRYSAAAAVRGFLVIVLVAAAALAVPASRSALLASYGRFLAADVVHSGVANRVAIFTDPPDPDIDQEFIRRGVPYEDAAARSARQLAALGIGHVERIPRAVAGTEDEGAVLPGWCDEHRFRTVVVVAMTDHCRRIRRVMRRAMRDHSTRVLVHGAHYSPFNPDRWWLSRGSLRTGIIEMEKLMLDFARHPLS